MGRLSTRGESTVRRLPALRISALGKLAAGGKSTVRKLPALGRKSTVRRLAALRRLATPVVGVGAAL
ncbi:hypothetical protein [Streptosporangium sp. 'caverna']|uniref:hypothetical protein n=1 Tax=Streptosporangium sp. 'caverna' TaxID=2202249 RepID=UPI0013A696F9|nr:hypothetical protein [Streptosporangium sp. 'caverna']